MQQIVKSKGTRCTANSGSNSLESPEPQSFDSMTLQVVNQRLLTLGATAIPQVSVLQGYIDCLETLFPLDLVVNNRTFHHSLELLCATFKRLHKKALISQQVNVIKTSTLESERVAASADILNTMQSMKVEDVVAATKGQASAHDARQFLETLEEKNSAMKSYFALLSKHPSVRFVVLFPGG